VAVAGLAGLAALWQLAPDNFLERVATALEPHAHSWYALPLAVLAFVVLSFLMLSVLAMTVVAGWVFGPWLGGACALAGCVASAAAGFWVGRWLGRERVERLGERVRRISKGLGENGVLAAFLLRKIPAPFTLVNIVAGASRIRFRDFLLGTVLGMGAIVILLAVFGDGLRHGLRGEAPTGAALAIAAVLLVLVFVMNRILKRRRAA
jgi:uncharacterized membrane protein YdjX (TVP38/TMEM64 family)